MILAKRSSAKCFKHEHKRSVGYTTCKCVRRRDWSYRNLQFFQLQDNTLPSSLHEETSTNENREQETTSAVAKKGDFASVVKGCAPKVLATKSCPFFYRKI